MILILLLLFPLISSADTDFEYGAVTYHLLGTDSISASHFRNKWSDDGRLIGTPILGFEGAHDHEDNSTYDTTKVFIGQNSVGGAMAGIMCSEGIHSGNWYRGVLAGIYAQDASEFYRYSIVPQGLIIGPWLNVVPVIGGELIYKFGLIKWHLVVSPTLALTYISFGI